MTIQAPRVQSGLRIDCRTTAPGLVEVRAAADHQLRIHAGNPVRGRCRRAGFVYTRGDVDIFPAGITDAWHEQGASTHLMLRIAPSFLSGVAAEMGLDPGRAWLEPQHQFRDAQIEHMAWALEAERAAGFPNGRLYVDSIGTALATHLLRRYAAADRSRHGLSVPRLRRVTAFIEEHLDGELSLATLAHVADLSPSHFKVLFKRSMGIAVHEYVVQRRVERAKTLLLQGSLPASQVALESGFAHQSHMARCMRRVLGVTPMSIARAPRSAQVHGFDDVRARRGIDDPPHLESRGDEQRP